MGVLKTRRKKKGIRKKVSDIPVIFLTSSIARNSVYKLK